MKSKDRIYGNITKKEFLEIILADLLKEIDLRK